MSLFDPDNPLHLHEIHKMIVQANNAKSTFYKVYLILSNEETRKHLVKNVYLILNEPLGARKSDVFFKDFFKDLPYFRNLTSHCYEEWDVFQMEIEIFPGPLFGPIGKEKIIEYLEKDTKDKLK